jgi:hypothetical protein
MNPRSSGMYSTGADASQRVDDYADKLGDKVASVRDNVSDAVDSGTEWATAKARDASDASQALWSSVCDTVSARPMAAIGIATVAGFLIARLFARD